MRERVRRLVAWLLRLVEWFLHTFATLLERLAAVGLVYSGVVLAAQTLMALLPLLIVMISLLPTWAGTSLAHILRERLGIAGQTDQAVGNLIASRPQLQGISIVSIIVVIASATSFTRALQRVYEMSWGLPRLGMRGSLRGLVWLVAVSSYFGVLALALHYAQGGVPAAAIKLALTVVGAVALWWWTPYVLLMGRVRLRSLLPCGVLTGVAVLVMGRVAAVVVPPSVRNNERRFGTIGVFFAIQSWLVALSCTIVAAAVIGAVAAQTSGPIGALARGSTDPEGWRRTRSR
jgi:membrane protein